MMLPEPIVVDDPADPALDDYRELNNQAARTAMEGNDFFIAEGLIALDRLIESGHRLRSVLIGTSRLTRFQPYLARPELADIPVFVADRDSMRAVVGFDLHRGVVASAERKTQPTVSELAGSARRLVVLEGLNDNENLGAIARAARAFGADGMVLSADCTDAYYRRTVRVSMGEVLQLPFARSGSDWLATLNTLDDAEFETWAMTPALDAVDLWDAKIPERLAVVLGAEGPGLTEATMAATTRRVRIPIDAGVDSLNVGHAAAVTLAVIRRPHQATT